MSTMMNPVLTEARPQNYLGAELGARHQAQARPYTLGENALLARQARQESNARSYPRRIPLALKRAKGIYVEDTEGRVFIDCLAGAGTLALGHNHPVVIEAIQRVLSDELPLHTLDLTTPVKDAFVQELLGLLPPEFARHARIQFCGPTGADAVEAALKLVKTATGRSTILAFHGAYHGMTHGALGLMGNLGPKRAIAGLAYGVQFLPYPYDYRCPFGLRGTQGVATNLHYIDNLLNDPESGVLPAAGLILEAVQGEGGVIVAPEAWMQGVRALTTKAKVPFIIDEVQTGFARTGRLFAFEHSGVMPDVLVLSKAIGGSLPLSVVVYREELDVWEPGAHAGTFRGNQMAMAAGLATMRFIVSERLDEHAAAMGQRFSALLGELQRRHKSIGDVRGRGLMWGVEIVGAEVTSDALGNVSADPALASRIQAECLRRGLIVELGGRYGSVVRFLPPLIITERQLEQVTDIFAAAVDAAMASRTEG